MFGHHTAKLQGELVVSELQAPTHCPVVSSRVRAHGDTRLEERRKTPTCVSSEQAVNDRGPAANVCALVERGVAAGELRLAEQLLDHRPEALAPHGDVAGTQPQTTPGHARAVVLLAAVVVLDGHRQPTDAASQTARPSESMGDRDMLHPESRRGVSPCVLTGAMHEPHHGQDACHRRCHYENRHQRLHEAQCPDCTPPGSPTSRMRPRPAACRSDRRGPMDREQTSLPPWGGPARLPPRYVGPCLEVSLTAPTPPRFPVGTFRSWLVVSSCRDRGPHGPQPSPSFLPGIHVQALQTQRCRGELWSPTEKPLSGLSVERAPGRDSWRSPIPMPRPHGTHRRVGEA